MSALAERAGRLVDALNSIEAQVLQLRAELHDAAPASEAVVTLGAVVLRLSGATTAAMHLAADLSAKGL